MPIVIGAPVGLVAGADVAAGALADDVAVAVAEAPVDEEPPAGAADFEELQPARSSAVTPHAAVTATGSGRQRRAVCNRLCETIESLHEGWGGVSGSGAWRVRPLRESCIGGLCNRLCN